MPLIWNDVRMELVDSMDFDRNEYVIVRKLFVRFKEHVKVTSERSFSQTRTENLINKSDRTLMTDGFETSSKNMV